MKKYQGFIPFALALILATIVVIFTLKDDKDDPRPIRPDYEHIKKERDSLRLERDSTQQQRDSLFLLVDSLRLSRKADSVVIKSLEKEIASIPGKYNPVPEDSLGAIMDKRAAEYGNQ